MLSIVSYSQEFSGVIIDAENKEPIPFASVYILSTETGTYTDSLGKFKFSIELPNEFDLLIRSQLYESKHIRVQPTNDMLIELNPTHQDLEDVIISAPGGGLGRENAFHVDRLDMNELNSIQSSTLGEAISNINGVQSVTTGTGISQPVIRGLSGVRVLTMINGVRTENQQWSPHHGMAVNELGVGAVEVIKGPSSLLYGSDAFGGVLFLIDEPYARQNSHELKLQTRFESVSMGTVNTAIYKMSKKNVRFSAAGLYSNNADYRMPDGNYLKDSRYNQIGGKFSLGITKKNYVGHLRYTVSTGRAGIPGHSHDSIPSAESFISSSQLRSANIPAQLITNHIASFENKFFFKRSELYVIIANTNNNLEEFEEKFTVPGIQMNLNNVYLNAKFIHKIGENWRIIPGVQSSYQTLTNGPKADELLIDDYTQVDNGAYALFAWDKNRWTVQFGARADVRSLEVSTADFRETYAAPSASAGFAYHVKKHTVHVNVSSAFRAPHSSELLSDGVHHGALRYEIGNRNLKPENAIQTDVNYEYRGEHFEWSVNPYVNYIQNFITLFAADSLIDEYPVFNYGQIDQSVLYGVDLGLHYHPHFAHWMHVESSFSYLKAQDLSSNPLPLIPQPRLNTFIRINPEFNRAFRVKDFVLQHQYFLPQNNVSTNETASVDYHLLNASVNFIWDKKNEFLMSFGVKNMLNQRYINHLSQLKNIGMPSPGANIYISLKYNFLTLIKSK